MSKNKKKRNKKYNPNKRNNSIMDNQRSELESDIYAVKKCVEGVGKISKISMDSLKRIDKKYACLQFQLMIQDLESILIHVEDLEVNGPKIPHVDIPLSDSEITEDQELSDNAGLSVAK